MKIKIISDGTSTNTHIIDKETGSELKGVQHINIYMDVHRQTVVELTVLGVELELDDLDSSVLTIDPESGLKVNLV